MEELSKVYDVQFSRTTKSEQTQLHTHLCNDTDFDLYIQDKSEDNRKALLSGKTFCLDHPKDLIFDGDDSTSRRGLIISMFPCKTGCLPDEEI